MNMFFFKSITSNKMMNMLCACILQVNLYYGHGNYYLLSSPKEIEKQFNRAFNSHLNLVSLLFDLK